MTWSVTDLGFLPGGTFSIAQAVSSDGSVIVGVAGDSDGNGHAFRWTAGGGMVDLGFLPSGTQSIAYGVSADGSIVVGNSDGGSSEDGNTEAFMWTAGGGMVGLGFLGTGTGSSAFGISPDGGTIVGTSSNIPGSVFGLPSYPFSWTSGGGMVNLGLYSSNPDGIGQGASTSAAKVIGGGNDPSDVPWQSISGSLSAVPLPGGETAGAALAISPDGNSIVGFSNTTPGDNSHAYLWTSGGGASLLGFLSGGTISDAMGVSGDGSAVVGFSNWTTNIFNQAFIWTSIDGMQPLPGLNETNPGGVATGISSDGSTIVGNSRGTEEEPGLHAVFWTQGGPPPSGQQATVAELWMSQTAGFVDLTAVSNRRKFISIGGGTQNLGSTGQNPFGVTPPVYLSSNGTPSTFATNNGRGGQFNIEGGTLTAGTDPPGSSSSTTTIAGASVGKGVLGDYRNGNLYSFNPNTLTDNGTQRKWVRRWRALPGSSFATVKFDYLAIDMQTGIGVPDGADPQLVLRWSDDGGHTFGPERIISAGRKGQTAFTVKFNRLGSTRRFSRTGRIYELSSTDPFQVSIQDAETGAS